MAADPFISICIPAFQRTNYLKRLLDSIEMQIFRDFEVVITDDSPGEEVRELAGSHGLTSMIRYFRNPGTLGSPENWNEGIRRSKAGWIKIMHDDDWFSGSDSLQFFAEAAKNGAADFYFSGYSNVFPDGRLKKMESGAAHRNALNKLPEILLASNRIGPPSVVIFKKDMSVLFDNRMQWLVDIDFYIRYLKKHPSAGYIPQNAVRIGISASQVTRRSFGKPEVEIPERFMLYEKLDPESIRNLKIYDSWWRFVRNLDIESPEKIIDSGYSGNIPSVIKNIILAQQKFPKMLLCIGIFSKSAMRFYYFIQYKK